MMDRFDGWFMFQIVANITKVVCGFKLIQLFSINNTWLFFISGVLLTMLGLNYLMPLILDEINDWNVRRLEKKDAPCTTDEKESKI